MRISYSNKFKGDFKMKHVIYHGEDTATYGRRYDESQFGGSKQSDKK